MKRSELKQIIREVIEESKLIQEFGPLTSPSRGSNRAISKSPRRKTKITVEYDYVPQNENFYTIRNAIGMNLIDAEKTNETKDKSVRNTTFILDYVLSDREEFELDKKLQKLLNDVIINEYEFNSTVEESIEPEDEYADLSSLEARKLIKSKLKELEQLDLSSEELEKVSTIVTNELEEEDEVHGKLNKAIIIAASILSLMTITNANTSDADFAKFLHKNVETTEHTGKQHQTKKEKSDEKASLYSSKLNDSRKRDDAADHRQLAQSINRIRRV